jgi:hypothetical protein
MREEILDSELWRNIEPVFDTDAESEAVLAAIEETILAIGLAVQVSDGGIINYAGVKLWAVTIDAAFTWSTSPRGRDYWSQLYTKQLRFNRAA